MNPRRKTQRRYGAIFQRVRECARARAEFSAADLVPQGLTPRQIRNACQRLIQRGELRRVAPGRPGRRGFVHAHYAAA